MKLLFENWRKYLNEVSFSDAKEILDSKLTLKIIKAYRYDKEQDNPESKETPPFTSWNVLYLVVPDNLNPLFKSRSPKK